MKYGDPPVDGTKQFAPDFERNEEGWIIVPDDVAWRKAVFPPSVMKHLAKLHMHIQQSIYHYVSEPGEVLLDPMGGTGTLMMAALEGRIVITLDIEEGYHELQKEVYTYLRANNSNVSSCFQLHGNCKIFLPIFCDHIITSPPYGQALKPSKTLTGIVADKYRVDEEEFARYASTTGNVGMHNTFLYNRDMRKVYKLYFQSLRPGGTVSIVIKDIIEKGKRTYFSDWILKTCHEIGFEDYAWFKVSMQGGVWQDIRRSKGLDTVDDEDIIILRRPL